MSSLQSTPSGKLLYVVKWDRLGRRGQLCEVTPGKRSPRLVQVKFRDGFTAVVDRGALRQATQMDLEKEAKNG